MIKAGSSEKLGQKCCGQKYPIPRESSVTLTSSLGEMGNPGSLEQRGDMT